MLESSTSKQSYSAEEILDISLEIGEQLLKCGGEISRVEDTVARVCKALGAQRVETFAITALLNVSVQISDGSVATQLRRIYGSHNNYLRFEQINAISRDLCQHEINIEQARSRIEKAKHAEPYSAWIVHLGAALAAGAFAVFFGGCWKDGLAAAIIGALINIFVHSISSRVNQIAHTMLSSFLAGILAILLVRCGLGENAGKVMIGTIMLLIPGISFGNSVRDLFIGDHISGSIRMIQSLLITVSVAIGYWLSASLLGGII